MKILNIILFAVIALNINTSCTAQSDKKDNTTQVSQAEKVEVYYFHYTRRCATCNAVESVSKETVAELYGDKVTFSEYNLDEDAGEAKGKELEVSGQSLLIVAGNTKIDITTDGFLNARSNPDKLKQIIKEKIDPLLW